MKNTIGSLIALLLIASHVCAQKANTGLYHGFVKYEPGAELGMISLCSSGFGKKKADCMKDAYKEAFKALLFQGIPGSQYEFPLVPDGSDKKEDPAIKTLLNEGYMTFVSESTIVTENKKTKRHDGAKGLMIVQKITVNYEALRKYLEQNQIIRKFGI
ncbi:MAG TPA: hypothetical protein VF008_28455 [Niastella sp.]